MMNQLVYYHPLALGGHQQPFHRCINPMISALSRAPELTWPTDMNYLVQFPMPKLSKTIADFRTISHARISNIMKQAANKTVCVLWSGGIDSTYILTLMIELGYAQQLLKEKRLLIGLNTDSIRENPTMFTNILLKHFSTCLVTSSDLLDTIDINRVILTGEMADNLVGSLTMKSCTDFYNDFSTINNPIEFGISWLTRKLNPNDNDSVRIFLNELINTSPIELSTTHDLFWYINFNLKWQAVNYRIVSHSRTQEHGNYLIQSLVHFFNTEDFQQWSMHTGHRFEGSSWSDYKKVLKQQIFSVNRDVEYLKHKTKYPSLPSLLRHRDTFDFVYVDPNTNHYTFTKDRII